MLVFRLSVGGGRVVVITLVDDALRDAKSGDLLIFMGYCEIGYISALVNGEFINYTLLKYYSQDISFFLVVHMG